LAGRSCFFPGFLYRYDDEGQQEEELEGAADA
jgi:hypothetical protein